MTDERIIAYLLGELPDEESERFEEECYADENCSERIGEAEEDLIHAYLSRGLTPEQRQHFERNYLTTKERRIQFAMVGALLTFGDTPGTEESPAPPVKLTWADRFAAFWGRQSWALRAGLAVGMAAVIAVALWLYRPRMNPPQGVATLTLTITTENRRDEGVRPERVKLPPEAGTLRISLKLPEGSTPAARHRVELVNDEGEARPLGIAGQNAVSLMVEVPAAQLTRGQYALRLFVISSDGTERRVNGSYFFIVE